MWKSDEENEIRIHTLDRHIHEWGQVETSRIYERCLMFLEHNIRYLYSRGDHKEDLPKEHQGGHYRIA